jgi:hypothetical protein
MSQIYYSSVLLMRLLGVGEKGEGGKWGGGGGGLSSNSQDSYFSHNLGNDYHIIIIILYDYRRFDAQCFVYRYSGCVCLRVGTYQVRNYSCRDFLLFLNLYFCA